ncbi:helix-turn-helix domain-containing protein [Peribacillus glennii]|uniref:XRE family transcriptional regulator n=1 Tax=Peribacillus glennii TaxID=2303991 RepID=A0A372LGL9_9BACI|nr:helix-turn-helix transcriptional regulator [Peribacillus glennii]RFU64756.1 XRE family transcriptional regulator [Peribacillus glennii]
MIGKKIAEIRKKRGYSLSELAKMAKVSKSYLSNIERGLNKNPSLQVMIRIAAVLEIDLVTLLKAETDLETNLYIEKEWVDFVNELKELGLDKEQIQQYKTLIEFIKWQNQNSDRK